jgi:hypothetical protein
LGDPNGEAKILNSVLIGYSIQDASTNAVDSFRTADRAVQIMLQHVKVAKGPQEVVIRRRLHDGEERTAVLGSARCVFWNRSLGYDYFILLSRQEEISAVIYRVHDPHS